MNFSKISIVIPVYNGRKYIEESISSCLLQDYPGELEVIVVDDGSKEPSCDIINNFVLLNDNIKYYKNDVNRGLMYTNNYAFSLVSGEYVVFLGQDDVLKPSHLKLLERKLYNNLKAFVWCNSEVIDSNGQFVKMSLNDKMQFLKTYLSKYFILKSNFISSTGLMMRVSALKSVGGWPTGFRNFGEWELWVLLISKYDIVYSDEICSKYRRHGNNISNFTEYETLPVDVAEYYKHCKSKAQEIVIKKRLVSKIRLFIFNLLWSIAQRVK
ncbi:glycosyltransferase family 2 protein [Marinomonas sp. BSi20584]|uniref:glycosyltransferase family 2 protein n=1 Tax=Marinomonas sp. BSi20584 TaxID=1594462 RepID=UPI000C1ED0CD|nr:glycosyltransferase family 2 protein [Marinomonas sp. BSi20584]